MKVCDAGSYYLYDDNKEIVAGIVENYVPNRVIPGDYGDYISMEIDETGKVTNMPNPLDFSEFLANDEDD